MPTKLATRLLLIWYLSKNMDPLVGGTTQIGSLSKNWIAASDEQIDITLRKIPKHFSIFSLILDIRYI